jgi:hypothetical protein
MFWYNTSRLVLVLTHHAIHPRGTSLSLDLWDLSYTDSTVASSMDLLPLVFGSTLDPESLLAILLLHVLDERRVALAERLTIILAILVSRLVL